MYEIVTFIWIFFVFFFGFSQRMPNFKNQIQTVLKRRLKNIRQN